MSKILKNIKIIFVFFLVNSFIVNLAIGTISNYSTDVFILKLVSSTLLFLLIIADIRINKMDIQNLLKESNPRKLLIILILFIGYLSLTLIYSDNPAYGAQKILNFLTSTIASIIAFYYFVITNSKARFGVFIFSIVFITIISVIYIIFDYPFEQSTIYEYRAGRWSHVIYGRMIGSFAVVLLLYTLSRRDLSQIIFYSVITSIAIYGLYLSALRSAMLGLVLVALCLSIFLILKSIFLVRSSELGVRSPLFDVQSPTEGKPTAAGKHYPISRIQYRNLNIKKLTGLLTVVIVTLTFIVLIPKPEIIETRFDNLTQIEDFKFGGDAPINTRIEALKISKELFLGHPVFGVGFGGFRSYNDFTEAVRYPHNLFVEMGVEGGVVGLLVLCALCFVLIKYTYRYSSYTLIFLLFSLILAFFSKELSNQALLWIGLAFYGIKKAD